jgi:hypothetical protein
VELTLEHLANAVQRTPIGCAGDEGRSFVLMLTINDVIDSDHGLSVEPSGSWLGAVKPSRAVSHPLVPLRRTEGSKPLSHILLSFFNG